MKTARLLFVFIFMLPTLVYCQNSAPFQRGVNLSNWFQKNSIQEVHFSRYTYEDFVDIQSLGVDVIRLPINLHGMTSGEPEYIVDPILLDFLDQIIDWTEALGLHLILDNHSFSPTGATTPSVNAPLSAIWPQLAEHFIDRDSTLYFEILNEPYGISGFIWDTIQQNVVSLIRQIDPNRTLIVGPTSWNSYNNLAEMMNYSDNNLIYTFHFYDPFIFTHQGASWTDPSMESLAGVPFPYGASPMPGVPPELLNTWIQNNMLSYPSQGNVAHMRELIDIAATFRESRGVPIYCGEFGVYIRNAIDGQRVEWYNEVTHYLDSLDISWTMWDYHGGFGLYEAGGYDLFDHDLNIPLVEAMGFTAPSQTGYVSQADSTGFYCYDDGIGKNIVTDNSSTGTIEMYNSENSHSGNYSLYWTEANQYERIGFNFWPDKDLSSLVADDYCLTLWARALGPAISFDIRFIDSKTAIPEDHPWRKGITLTAADINWDGSWQYIQLPLSELEEKGSWDGDWFEPMGLFDWSAVDILEISSEQGAFNEAELWFDDIRIVDQQAADIDSGMPTPHSFFVNPNYPNPFNPETTISYYLPEASPVKISVFDIQGRELDVLLNQQMSAGQHQSIVNAGLKQYKTGIYFARVDAGGQSRVVKMLYLK